MIFPIICGLILIFIIIIFYNKPKKKKVEDEVISKERQPVIIELIPKGTKANPILCKVSDEISFQVKGYTDYKKENEVDLNGNLIKWWTGCPCGSFKGEYGVCNIYYAPDFKGERDIYIKYNDGKLISTTKSRVLVEVK